MFEEIVVKIWDCESIDYKIARFHVYVTSVGSNWNSYRGTSD